MKKGTCYLVAGSEYKVVGEWNDAVVLAPVEVAKTECILLLASEIEDEVRSGRMVEVA